MPSMKQSMTHTNTCTTHDGLMYLARAVTNISAAPLKLRKSKRQLVQSKSTPPAGFLQNDGRNSCYLDALLVALLHPHKSAVASYILSKRPPHSAHPNLQQIALQIQEELHAINASINGATPRKVSCRNLRSLFSRFEPEYKKAYKRNYIEEEWTHRQNAPADVINILMRVFDVKPDVHTNRGKLWFNAPEIYAYEGMRKVQRAVSDYIPITTNVINDQKDKVIKLEYKKAKCMYINVMRNFDEETKMTSVVKIPEQLTLTSGKTLNLSSIIVHLGSAASRGHYIAFIKRKNTWYLFDDLEQSYERIGSFKDVLEWRAHSVLRNCVGMFYV